MLQGLLSFNHGNNCKINYHNITKTAMRRNALQLVACIYIFMYVNNQRTIISWGA